MNHYHFQRLLTNQDRIAAWRLLGTEIAENVRLGPRLRIRDAAKVSIGTGTAIIGRAWIDSWGRVDIGRNVLVNDDVSFLTASHDVHSTTFEGDIRPIVVRDHAWLPLKIIVLPGVTIGEAAVVGSGSVVARDVPDYAIAAGNPAVVVSMRTRQKYEYVPSTLG